jgi:zinc D-Ala-D-Ala carboxypeptidase
MNPITAADLACPCCQTCKPNPTLLDALNLLQTMVGTQLQTNSGYRCPKHNAAVGGAPHSEHLTGEAADIRCANLAPISLYLAAEQIPAFSQGGIGLYPADFIHLDVRPTRARWFRKAGRDYPIIEYLHPPS